MIHRILKSIFILISFVVFVTAAAGSTQAKSKSHSKVTKTAKHKHRNNHPKRVKKTRTKKPKQIGKHYPPPGSSGEERNFDWLRKRAFPNEYLDPSYYPNALEQARRLPVWKPAGRENIQSAMQWQQIGPYTIGGRVTALATHPTDSNTFYVGAASGGLWKTIDHGTTWTALTDTFASLPIGCITLDPHDANTIYLGMGECNGSADSYPGNGLWRSIDAGLTWTNIGLVKTQYIAKVIVDPVDKNVIYVCVPGPENATDTNRGVWKSIDQGVTWRHSLFVRSGPLKTSTPVPVIDLVLNPQDRGDLVAALWDKFSINDSCTGLWRSRDSGATWKRIDILSPTYPNGALLKRLGRTSIFFANTLRGSTLYSVVTKIDTNAVTHFPSDENLFGVFKTKNPEGDWIKILDSTYRIPYLGNNVDSADLFYRQAGYDNFIVGHPTRPSEIYIGGIDVIRTTDAGSTWTNITRAYPHYFNNDRSQHSDMHALAFTAGKSGDDLLNGQDGGVFNTRNYGTSWARVNGLPITMFYHLEPWVAGMVNLGSTFPADSLKIFGGTQDNGTVGHGFSANADWDWINRGDGGEAQADPNNKDHIITSLQLGKVFFRTTLDSLRPNLYTDNGNHDPNAKKWFELLTIMRRRGIADSSEPCTFIPPVVLDKNRGDELYTGRTHIYRAKLSFTDPDSSTMIYKWSPQLTGVTNNPKRWFYGGDIESIALGVRDLNNRPMIWTSGIGATQTPSGLSGGTGLWRTVYNPLLPQDSAPRWISVTSGLPSLTIVSAIACDRNDSMTAFAGVLNYGTPPLSKHLYKTTNGGKNWISISGKNALSSLPTAPLNAIIIDSLAENGNPLAKNQCLIAATDVGVFVTSDGGTTWSNLGTGMPHVVVGTITQYKNWLIAGTHGRSAWALDISALQAQPLNAVHEKQNSPNQFAIRNMYPSPLDVNNTSILHIIMNGVSDKYVSIDIMNAATGASVYTTHSQMNGEALELQVPANISSGSYIVQIITLEGKRATGQIMIVK